MIDEEIRAIIKESYDRTVLLLHEKREQLEIVAQELLKKEILFQSDLVELIGKRPFEKETAYQEFMNNGSDIEIPTTLEETK